MLKPPRLGVAAPICLWVIVFFLNYTSAENYHLFSEPFPCDNDIFCYGDIIHTVQRSRNKKGYDSKAFVDMKLKYEPHIVKSNFKFLTDHHGLNPPKEEIDKFVEHNFDPAGSEFEPWVPSDWTATPAILSTIKDNKYREFVSELNSFWKVLGRHIKKDVCARPEFYSMICVTNPLIVPGGRFIEFYYWDQFWILRGLLHSQMTSTVKGMLDNFIQMVNKPDYGFIPNGGRIYYRRSHPPLLIPMFKDYLDATGDLAFVEKNIDTLDKEFRWWMENRLYNVTKDGQNYTVARYNNELGNPRPEAYNPDYDLAALLPSHEEQTELYYNLKTSAESGIDFSSRWFVPKNPDDVGHLSDTKTRWVLPVDLNALIYRNARLLANFHRLLDNEAKAVEYDLRAEEWKVVIDAVFWDDVTGTWFDWVDLPGGFKGFKRDFYPANILPLINGETQAEKVDRVIDYLEKEGVLKYEGGVPSSHIQTGEQWDFPNAWAPLVHWFIESLENTKHPRAMEIAKNQASNWVKNNYLTYRSHNNTMFEKYDVTNVGNSGGGGEYEVVIGFGWSNGVVMDFLHKYGNIFEAPNEGGDTTTPPPQDTTTDPSTSTDAGTNLVTSFFAIFVGLCLTFVLRN